jgi:hypothetical protein
MLRCAAKVFAQQVVITTDVWIEERRNLLRRERHSLHSSTRRSALRSSIKM